MIDDLARVAANLGMGKMERELAARITARLRPGAQLRLEPGSVAEQHALATALSELIWDRHGGQLLRGLRDAGVAYPLNTPDPIHDGGTAAPLVNELLQRARTAPTRDAERD